MSFLMRYSPLIFQHLFNFISDVKDNKAKVRKNKGERDMAQNSLKMLEMQLSEKNNIIKRSASQRNRCIRQKELYFNKMRTQVRDTPISMENEFVEIKKLNFIWKRMKSFCSIIFYTLSIIIIIYARKNSKFSDYNLLRAVDNSMLNIFIICNDSFR